MKKSKEQHNMEFPLFLEDMTTIAVEKALKAKIPLYFPIGTLEAHGRHLPSGTDTLCAVSVAIELASRLSGIIAPPLSYGLTNLLAQTSPGSFYPEDLYRSFLEHTIRNFGKQGFKTILMVNGHGGNRTALMHAARSAIRESPLAVSVINWWLLAEEPAKKVYGTTGGHAAVEETAAILHFFPELVEESQYEPELDDFVPEDGMWCYPPPGEVLLYNGEGKGRPNFDRKKAGDFMAGTLEVIVQRVKKWLKHLSRLQGGLRP